MNRERLQTGLLFTLWFLNTAARAAPGQEPLSLSVPTILIALLGLTYFTISFFSIPVGLAILAVSMMFSPEFAVGATAFREITVRIEDLLIPVLVLAWIAHLAVKKQLQGFRSSPLNRPILWLLLLSVVSTVAGYFRGSANLFVAFFYFGKTLEYFGIFFLVLNNVRTERQIKYFLFFAILTVALLALYTLPQVPKAEIFTLNRITAPFEGDRPQPTTVAGYMAFFLVILIGFLLYERNPMMRWCLSVLSLAVFIPFLFSFSRTSYVALLGGLIVLAILARKKQLNYLLLAFLILSPVILPRQVKERIAFTWLDARNPYRHMGVDYSSQERIMSFKNVMFSLKISPVIGLGITGSRYLDNQYARTLQELGLLGLGLWLWIYLRLFKLARWLHKNLEDGMFKGLALGYAAGVVCILLHAFGSITFYVVRIMEPFWFVSGLVVSLYLIKVREYASQAR